MSAREELQTQNLLIAASEMLLVALFSFLLGRYLTSNLKQLQQATAAIASGGPGVTVPARGPAAGVTAGTHLAVNDSGIRVGTRQCHCSLSRRQRWKR